MIATEPAGLSSERLVSRTAGSGAAGPAAWAVRQVTSLFHAQVSRRGEALFWTNIHIAQAHPEHPHLQRTPQSRPVNFFLLLAPSRANAKKG